MTDLAPWTVVKGAKYACYDAIAKVRLTWA